MGGAEGIEPLTSALRIRHPAKYSIVRCLLIPGVQPHRDPDVSRIDYIFGPPTLEQIGRVEVLRDAAVGRMDHWPLLVEVGL